MDTAQLGQLAVLALVDATSAGTLFIPIALMLSPYLRATTLAVYLATVAAFYFLLGIAPLTAGRAVMPVLEDVGDSRPFLVARVVVGAGLFALSFAFTKERIAARKAA